MQSQYVWRTYITVRIWVPVRDTWHFGRQINRLCDQIRPDGLSHTCINTYKSKRNVVFCGWINILSIRPTCLWRYYINTSCTRPRVAVALSGDWLNDIVTLRSSTSLFFPARIARSPSQSWVFCWRHNIAADMRQWNSHALTILK
jgi:hypothetical protein